MKKFTLTTLLFIMLLANAFAQKYYSKTTKAYFKNNPTVGTIEATNKATTLVIDSKTGAVAVSILIKGFTFEKALMQQHFNETYLESDKFPKAEFKGTIANNDNVKYTTDGTYSVKITGKLTIHGVTKDMATPATIAVKAGAVTATTEFNVSVEDYNIAIPAAVKNSVGKNVKIIITTDKLMVK